GRIRAAGPAGARGAAWRQAGVWRRRARGRQVGAVRARRSPGSRRGRARSGRGALMATGSDERPPGKGSITVLIADDQRLLREGLRTLLELHADLRVVGEAGDGLEAERLVELLQPCIVLMDLRMPRRDGV